MIQINDICYFQQDGQWYMGKYKLEKNKEKFCREKEAIKMDETDIILKWMGCLLIVIIIGCSIIVAIDIAKLFAWIP